MIAAAALADDGWIVHEAYPCPVSLDTMVDIKTRDGKIWSFDKARTWTEGRYDWWKHEVPNHACDIVAYRLSESSEATADTSGDQVDHPRHYGGADDPFEAIKVIEAWGLGFNLGNVIKYIARAERKGTPLDDLRKARWYLDREIARRETA